MSTNTTAYMKAYRADRIKAGRCLRCGNRSKGKSVHCADHIQAGRVTAKEAYDRRRAAGQCGSCAGQPQINPATGKPYALCEACKGKQRDRRRGVR